MTPFEPTTGSMSSAATFLAPSKLITSSRCCRARLVSSAGSSVKNGEL